MKLLKWNLGAFILFFSLSLGAAASQFEEVKSHYQKGELSKAYKLLKNIPMGNLDPKRMALIELFKGIISYEKKDYKSAIAHLNQSTKIGTRLEDVSEYYKGLSGLELQNSKAAESSFRKVSELGSSSYLSQKSRYHVAEIQQERGDLSSAKKSFMKLERKMRGSEFYPDILLSLLKINQVQKRNSQSCVWAKKLYTRHPTYEPILHWGLEWKDNLVNGKALSCRATEREQISRIKRLQLSGASDKAYAELQVFQKSGADQMAKDVILSEYFINEGHVRKALDLLLPYYAKNKKDFRFVSLLAKAASRSGEYQMAVGMYGEIAKKIRGTDQRRALYRAAFLSYQHQDYDGALRRFKNLKKKHPRSSLSKQANWYIPWIYYLRGSYQKAYDLLKVSLKRRHHLPSGTGKDKVKYWMAMSLLKLGNKKAAQDQFLELSSDDFIGYYSVAAVQRLKDLNGIQGLARREQGKVLPIHENWLPNYKRAPSSQEEQNKLSKKHSGRTKTEFFVEWEDLPFMKEYLDMENPAEIFSQVDEPKFRKHLERAKDLSLIGNQKLAKWELYSIEGRTKNKDYLKSLMFEYHRNDVFHRSSYIGTRHFGEVRSHLGLHLGASLWQFVYPRAFEKEVLASSSNFDVPAEFVWSIMKAETNFRPDAVSPVGAKGLMQVMTHTGRKVASLMGSNLNGKDLIHPQVSIKIGTRYLQRVLKKFKGKIPLAAAAYNGGPHRVHTWLSQFGQLDMDEFIEHIPYVETRNYVKKVVRYYTVYNLLYHKKTDSSSWLAELVNVNVEGTPPTRETWEVL